MFREAVPPSTEIYAEPDLWYSRGDMAKQHYHRNVGTCSSGLSFTTDAGRVVSVEFEGGCKGNLAAIARLVQGMRVEEVVSRLEGIACGCKATSCPDQLAKALREADAGA